MRTLIVPAAGLSTRYPTEVPKFLWRHPEGETMLVAGLRGIASVGIDNAIIVTLKSYVTQKMQRELVQSAEKVLGCNVKLVLLEEPTPSMVDTIAAGIAEMPKDGPLVIKDTDNKVEVSASEAPIQENFVISADLRLFDDVTASNKSFVEFDSFGLLTNIIEKRITSSYINTGLVGFTSAAEFLGASSGIHGAGEKYVSDVIRKMLQTGSTFRVMPAESYEDWGTHKEWIKLRGSYVNMMVSLEGVIFSATGENATSGELVPLVKNIQTLKKLLSGKKATLTLISSRPEAERHDLERELRVAGFEEFKLLLDLYSAKSYVVSAYSAQAPFPNVLHLGVFEDTDLTEPLLGSI